MNDPHQITADAWIDAALGELHGERPSRSPEARRPQPASSGPRRLVTAAVLLLGLAVPLAIWLSSPGAGSARTAASFQDPTQDPGPAKQAACKVLLIGTPNWDVRYTRTALLRHPGVALSTCLAPVDPAAGKPTRGANEREKTVGIPQSLEDLAEFDAVLVLGRPPSERSAAQDVATAARSSRSLLRLTHQYVQAGGTALVCVRPEFLAAVANDEELEPLVPESLAPAKPPEGSAPHVVGPILITPAGETDIPAAGKAAPLASWTERVKLARPGQAEEAPPALQIHSEGEGTAIAVSPDLWRIRASGNPQAFDHFWASVIEHCRPRQK